jgi:hypothetical protein
MLSQLDSKVAGMRSQFMTFNNNGIEFQLSVPDTNDVKSTLGSFVTTIVEQKDTIDDLNKDMLKMSKDHDASMSSIMAWATQCITDLKNQNAAIESQLREAVAKLNNFSYNMQGYADKDDVIHEVDDLVIPSAPTSGYTSMQPSAHVSRAPSAHPQPTQPPTPKPASPEPIVAVEPPAEPTEDNGKLPAQESTGLAAKGTPAELATPSIEPAQVEHPLDDEKPVIFFPTERQTGDDDGSNQRQRNLGSARDTDDDKPTELVSINGTQKKQRRRTNSLLYLSTPTTKVPKTARGRWLWAFGVVRKMLRMRNAKISLTRTRVVKGQSMLDRLERLESELFAVTSELDKVNAQRKQEMEMLDSILHPPKDPTPEPDLEPQPELVPEPETEPVLEPEPIELRAINCINCEKLQNRIFKLTDKATQIRESMESLDKICPYLIDQSTKFQDPKTHQDGDHLQAYLKLDSEIRTARAELRLCESNSFLLEELIGDVDAAVKEITQYTDYDEQSAPVVESMSTSMSDLNRILDSVKTDISKMTDLMFLHSNDFAENWKSFVRYLESAPSNAALMHSIDLINVAVREVKEHVFDMDDRVVKIEQSDIMNPVVPVINLDESENAKNGQDFNSLPENWSEKLQPLVQDMIDAYLEANMSHFAPTLNKSRANSRHSMLSVGDTTENDDGLDETLSNRVDDDGSAGGDFNGGDNNDTENGFRSSKDNAINSNEDDNFEAANEDIVLTRHTGTPSPQLAAEAAAKKTAKAEELKLKMVAKKKEAALLAQQQADEKARIEAEAKAAAQAAKKAQQIQHQQLLQQQQQQAVHEQQQQEQQRQILQQESAADSMTKQPLGDGDRGNIDEFKKFGASRSNSLLNEADSKPGQLGKTKSNKKKIGLISSSERDIVTDTDDDVAAGHENGVDDTGVDDSDAGGNVFGLDPSMTVTKIRPKKKEPQSIRDMLSKQRSAAGNSNTGVAMSMSGKEINVGNEIALIVRKMEEIYQDKLDTEKGMEMLATKANAYDLQNKVDVDMFEAVERSLQTVTQELGDLRRLQKQELEKVKAGIQKNLMKALGSIMAQREPSLEPGISALSTKAICLNCGRESLTRPTPQAHYQPSPFPNALVTHSTPGSDVMRGGFKLPVTKPFNPMSASVSSMLDSGEGGMDDSAIANVSTELGPLSPINANRSLKSAGAMTGMSQSLPAGGMSAFKVVKAIRHAQGRDEGTHLRPIYRKGFPAGKTLKADVSMSRDAQV